jgi:acetolactate synthase regulatory subunit
MRVHLTIHLSPETGAVVRTLSAIERRGHSLVSLCSQAGQGGLLEIDLEIETHGRASGVLVRHLQRLLDVREVKLAEAS